MPISSESSSKSRVALPSIESSAFLKMLGGVGAIFAFLGGATSAVSGLFLSDTLHSQYGAEHSFIIVLSLIAGATIIQDRLRILGYIGLALLFTVALCVSNEVLHRLDSATLIDGVIASDTLKQILRESVLSLWYSHVGWSLLVFAVIILLFVGNRAGSYAFYDAMQRRRAYRQGQIISRRDEVFSEISRAPLWPLAYGSILILSGILILFAGGEVSLARKLLGALVSEFGFAFFIAYVLTITIEIHAKREHDRQANRGLLATVYGVNLDQNLFQATEQYVFKNHFYRRNVVVEFDFLRVVGEWMLLKCTLTYAVENVSSGTATYLIDGHVEKSPEHMELLDPGMEFGLNKIFVGGIELSPEQIKAARARVADDEKYRRSRHEISIAAGESKWIRTVTLTSKRVTDNELWRSLLPCASASLRITWPEAIKLKVLAEPVHPCDDFRFLDQDLKTRSLFATIDRPLFPHNGFIFWWSPEGSDLKAEAASAGPGRAADAAPVGESPGAASRGISARRRVIAVARAALRLPRWLLRVKKSTKPTSPMRRGSAG